MLIGFVNFEEEEEEEEEEAAMKGEFYRPAAGQDIYGRSTDSGQESAPQQRYVPPALRGKAGRGVSGTGSNNGSSVPESEERTQALLRLKRTVTGQLNRLAEPTVEGTSKALGAIFREHASADVTEVWPCPPCLPCPALPCPVSIMCSS